MLGDYYGLSFNPFDKNYVKTKDCYQSEDFKSMMAQLKYLKDSKGIGLFTSRPGMGKSYCLHCFADSLNPNLYRMLYICLSTVSVAEFYKQFCSILGLNDKGGKTVMYKRIQEQIRYFYQEKRQPLILAIDEAQYLSDSILNDIQMLMNFDYDSINCFALILSGETYLIDNVCKPVHEALKERITIHYSFGGLSENEVHDYVLHKIASANGSRSIIDEAALNALTGLAHGSPRRIDNIMSKALAIGTTQEKKTVDAALINDASESLSLG